MAITVNQVDLKDLTYSVVEAGLKLMGEKVQLTNGDPEDWADLPMVAINLTSDSEAQSHIGDSMDDETIGEEDEVYAGISALFQQTVEVTLWTNNKLQRDRLGQLLKALLLYGRGTSANPGLFTATTGIHNVRITGGADQGVVNMSGETAPHAIYLRTYYVSATTEVSIQEPAGPPIGEVQVRAFDFNDDPFANFPVTGPSL